MYIGLRVKYPLFLSILMKLGFSRQIFEKWSNVKFHENPSSGSRVVPIGQTWRSWQSLFVIFFERARKKDQTGPGESPDAQSCKHSIAPTDSTIVGRFLEFAERPSAFHEALFSIHRDFIYWKKSTKEGFCVCLKPITHPKQVRHFCVHATSEDSNIGTAAEVHQVWNRTYSYVRNSASLH